MSAKINLGGGGELRIETDQIEVTSNLPKPDRSWRYIDAQGHEHYWRDGWPTLVTVVEDTYWCADCNDEHDDTHFECPQCGEWISPGMVEGGMFREFMPGRTSYYLDGQPITKEQAEEIIAARRGAS